MSDSDTKYGVAWRTLTSKQPTSVFFSSKKNRSQYIFSLKRNPLVRQESITLYIKIGSERPVLER